MCGRPRAGRELSDRPANLFAHQAATSAVSHLPELAKFLDGQSVNKQGKDALMKFTFIGKKLDFLELDFLDEEGGA